VLYSSKEIDFHTSTFILLFHETDQLEGKLDYSTVLLPFYKRKIYLSGIPFQTRSHYSGVLKTCFL
jgi:hypothetical protein